MSTTDLSKQAMVKRSGVARPSLSTCASACFLEFGSPDLNLCKRDDVAIGTFTSIIDMKSKMEMEVDYEMDLGSHILP